MNNALLSSAKILRMSNTAFHAYASELWASVLTAPAGPARERARGFWRWAHATRSAG